MIIADTKELKYIVQICCELRNACNKNTQVYTSESKLWIRSLLNTKSAPTSKNYKLAVTYYKSVTYLWSNNDAELWRNNMT